MFFMAIGETIFNHPELRFYDLLFPWIMAIGVLGFVTAWLVISILEWTDLTRYIWHLPLAFLALVVLFGSLIGIALLP